MERLKQRLDFQVQWRAFELRPEGVEVPDKPKEYYARAWEGVRRLSQEFGLEMQRNPHRSISRPALEGQKYAYDHGKGEAYTRRVFRARFVDLVDTASVDELARCAAAVGLDETDFRQALAERRYKDAVDLDVYQAYRWGITAIPCFVSGRKGLLGVQSEEALEALILGKL